MQPVEPNDNQSWRERAIKQLAGLGVCAETAEWWADTLEALQKVSPDLVIDGELDAFMIKSVAGIVRQPANAAMVEFIARACGHASSTMGLPPTNTPRGIDDPTVTELIRRATSLGVDFTDGLLQLIQREPTDINFKSLAPLMARGKLVAPGRLFDVEAIKAIGRDPMPLLTGVKGTFYESARDLLRPDFWLLVATTETLEGFSVLLEREAPETRGELARGFLKIIDACTRAHNDGAPFTIQTVVHHLLPMLMTLTEQQGAGAPDGVRFASWRFAWWVEQGSSGLIPPDKRKMLVAECTEHWGRFREMLRNAVEKKTVETALEPLGDAKCVLALLGSTWKAFKAALLAFRSVQRPAVFVDLRYWLEQGDNWQEYEPWMYFARTPAELLHAGLGREQAGDPMLEDFRTKFADFCLERLETREKSATPHEEEMIESNPHWRHCYVRAVRELRVNPAKRGHRTLHWSSKHDPSPVVREAARIAYHEISSHVKLEEGRSPRSAIFAAYWWLRQAHLLALGIQPDADGAQRTRIKELRRTKEAEQVSKPRTEEPKQV